MIGSLICVGSSVAVTIGLISKLIQYIRFINISYSPQLQDILQTWGTDILNLNIPPQIDRRIVSTGILTLFTKYGVEPSFLSNYWGGMTILLAALAVWVTCHILMCGLRLCNNTCANITCSALKRLSSGAMNFLVVTIYEGFEDVIFFSVLEMKSLSFSSSWSTVSFIVSLFFIGLGLCFIGLHWRFLIGYHKLQVKFLSKLSTESS